MTGRVYVVGALQLQVVTEVDRLPGPGESAAGRTSRRVVGGRGADRAVAARAAGSRVVMVGAVGGDDAARWCTGRLEDHGIETRLTTVGRLPTGLAVTARDPLGTAVTLEVPGANAALGEDALEALADLEPRDVVVVGLELPEPTVVEVCRLTAALGARLVVAATPYAPLPGDVCSLADPLVVDEHGAAELADGTAVPGSLLVSFGAAGAVWGLDRVDGPGVPEATHGIESFQGVLAAALVQDVDRRGALALAVQASAARS